MNDEAVDRAKELLPLVLLGLTATTGMVDAVSFPALGHGKRARAAWH